MVPKNGNPFRPPCGPQAAAQHIPTAGLQGDVVRVGGRKDAELPVTQAPALTPAGQEPTQVSGLPLRRRRRDAELARGVAHVLQDIGAAWGRPSPVGGEHVLGGRAFSKPARCPHIRSFRQLGEGSGGQKRVEAGVGVGAAAVGSRTGSRISLAPGQAAHSENELLIRWGQPAVGLPLPLAALSSTQGLQLAPHGAVLP